MARNDTMERWRLEDRALVGVLATESVFGSMEGVY
jgi:hypothetical protein